MSITDCYVHCIYRVVEPETLPRVWERSASPLIYHKQYWRTNRGLSISTPSISVTVGGGVLLVGIVLVNGVYPPVFHDSGISEGRCALLIPWYIILNKCRWGSMGFHNVLPSWNLSLLGEQKRGKLQGTPLMGTNSGRGKRLELPAYTHSWRIVVCWSYGSVPMVVSFRVELQSAALMSSRRWVRPGLPMSCSPLITTDTLCTKRQWMPAWASWRRV